MLTNEKSRAATLVMATRLSISKDPWLSVPALQQAWLFLCLNYIISEIRKSNVMNIATGNLNHERMFETGDRNNLQSIGSGEIYVY
jgi:hypothetical protein